MSAMRQNNWCAMYRRGFDAAVLMAFVGPAAGGAAFGLMMYFNQIVLAVQQGQFPGPPKTLIGELFVFFFLPVTTALMAFALPPVWYMVAMAALRAGPGCLNRFSAPISGASAGVRPPRGAEEDRSRLDPGCGRQGSNADGDHCKSRDTDQSSFAPHQRFRRLADRPPRI